LTAHGYVSAEKQTTIRAAVAEGFQDGLHSKYLTYIANKLSLNIEISTMPFARRVQALKHGELDLMVGVQRTEERQDEFIYINPHYETLSYRFFTLKENQKLINRYGDLRGKYIGVNRHAKYFVPFDEDVGLKKFEVTSLRQNVELLMHKRIDVFIHYEQSTLPLLADIGALQQIVKTPYQPSHENHHYLAISSHSSLTQRKAELERIISEAKKGNDFLNIRLLHYAEYEARLEAEPK
jgi:ABC-type amino acid transport substrate-binding protein